MWRVLIFVLPLIYSLFLWHFSATRTRRELAARSRPLNHPRLSPVLGKLAAALDIPGLKVNVLDDPQLNGLAAPDGQIYLTRGFIEALDRGEVTPEELGSVIAHEMGHVAHGHLRRRMIDFGGRSVLTVAVTGLLIRVVPVVGPLLANLAMAALSAKLSQRDEYEADAYATALMLKAGLGAGPQTRLLGQLERLSKTGAGGPPVWLRSHPVMADRIAAIEANVRNWS